MNPTNINNLQITTDYPLDKIIDYKSGSFTLPGFDGGTDITIPHELSFIPLGLMDWTTDSTWELKYETGAGPAGVSDYLYNSGISCFATNYRLTFRNNTPTAVTIYYRIYSFVPSNALLSAADFTNNLGQNYLINSDNNYAKLYLNGFTPIPAAPSGVGTTVILHDLGKRPQVLLWGVGTFLGTYPVSGQLVEDSSTPFALFDSIWFEVTDQNLLIYNRNTAKSVHYRIYVDDQQ